MLGAMVIPGIGAIIGALISLFARKVPNPTVVVGTVMAIYYDAIANAFGQVTDTTLVDSWLREMRKDANLIGPGFNCWCQISIVWRSLLQNDYDTASRYQPAIQLIEKAIMLYKGPFLADDPDSQFGQSINDRLRRRLLSQLGVLAEHWERKSDLAQAVNTYDEALRIDPCAEDIGRGLITAYHRLGRPAEFLSVYNALNQASAWALRRRRKPQQW